MSNPNPVNPTLTYKKELERLRREVFEPVKHEHITYRGADDHGKSWTLQPLHARVQTANKLGWDVHLTTSGEDLIVTYVKRPSRW